MKKMKNEKKRGPKKNEKKSKKWKKNKKRKKTMCFYVLSKLVKKYKKMTKKYITMNETTNPHLNSQDNTVYYVKNESEHSKNSEDLYKNNTQRIKNK